MTWAEQCFALLPTHHPAAMLLTLIQTYPNWDISHSDQMCDNQSGDDRFAKSYFEHSAMKNQLITRKFCFTEADFPRDLKVTTVDPCTGGRALIRKLDLQSSLFGQFVFNPGRLLYQLDLKVDVTMRAHTRYSIYPEQRIVSSRFISVNSMLRSKLRTLVIKS